jgi:hypothetical protein
MATVAVIAMLGFLVVLPTFVVWKLHPAIWISGPVLLFVGVMLKCFVGITIKAFRSTNWLMRIASDGLWINLRSYLNREFAPAPVVLFLPYAEIASVGESTVKRSERDHDGTTVWTDRYLDVRLVEPAPAELAAEISEERRRFVPGKHLAGLVTSRRRNSHVPVSLPDEQTLRLAWRSRFDFITPSLKSVLRELAGHCTIDEAATKDLSDDNLLTGEEVDRLILQSVETGDRFGAMKLLQTKRGYSLTEAKKFVDELTVQL